jgi:hypothetical protein
MNALLRGIFAALPDLARFVLSLQRLAGVQHSTWVGTAAQWILRGDRRRVDEEPAEGTGKRLSDQVEIGLQVQVPDGEEEPGGGP